MDKNVADYNLIKLNLTKLALEKKNYEVYIVNTKEEAVIKLEELIENKTTVSFGGSMTLFETGIIDKLHTLDINLLDRYKESLTNEDIQNLFRETFFADYYITSSNAITETGELVNLDGNGNRVAAMIFGPKKVIIIAGINKIVKDLDSAYERVRNIASPINCKRLSKQTPCIETARCHECNSKDRICNHYVVTYRQNIPKRGYVILVNETLGY